MCAIKGHRLLSTKTLAHYLLGEAQQNLHANLPHVVKLGRAEQHGGAL